MKTMGITSICGLIGLFSMLGPALAAPAIGAPKHTPDDILQAGAPAAFAALGMSGFGWMEVNAASQPRRTAKGDADKKDHTTVAPKTPEGNADVDAADDDAGWFSWLWSDRPDAPSVRTPSSGGAWPKFK